MDEHRRRQAVARALTEGTAPREQPVKTWAGHGTNQRCAICGFSVTAADVEYEVEFASGRSMTLHRQCHALWSEQRDTADGLE